MSAQKDIPLHQSRASEADADPLALVLRPPTDESPAQRAARLRDEAEAKKVSDSIDAQINVEREERERAKKRGDIKILLLGESNCAVPFALNSLIILTIILLLPPTLAPPCLLHALCPLLGA